MTAPDEPFSGGGGLLERARRLVADAEKWREQERSDLLYVPISKRMLAHITSPRRTQPVTLEVIPIEANRVELVCHEAFRFAGYHVLVESRHGPMLVNRNDIYVGGSFLKYGEFSHGETRLFEALVRPGMTVVNVGANIGAHAIRLAQICAPGVCYAFEPQRFAYQLLVANGALNSLDNLSTMRAAVGDAATERPLRVPVLDPRARQNFGGLELNASARDGEVVPVVEVDQLRLERLDLLMADVEGMEAAVLRGARETIERCLPMIYVEADRQAQRAELLALLTDFGYAAYWHAPPLFNRDNYKGETENIFENVVSLNWFCVPENRELDPSWQRVTTENLA